MQFISMDLIGKFHPPTIRNNKYALTVICMLMGYVFCVPLKNKAAEEVVQAYIDNIYSKFGGSIKILSDNGTEFKNKIFEQVAKELGVVHKLYTPPYHPASNGRIEEFHAFLKACIAKHVVPQLEWEVWCLWHVLLIILYPMSTQKNHLSFLCLEETLSYLLILCWVLI